MYKNPHPIDLGEEVQYEQVSIDLIDCYPDDEHCVDNVPNISEAFDYIIEAIKKNTFQWHVCQPIRVTPVGDRYFTIDASRLWALRCAVADGHSEFKTIPVRLANVLRKEIRRIRLFEIEHVRQGFICDDWEEAKELSKYMDGIDRDKSAIQGRYRWINDYLTPRKQNVWMDLIAMPVTVFLKHYQDNPRALEWVDLNSLMGWK